RFASLGRLHADAADHYQRTHTLTDHQLLYAIARQPLSYRRRLIDQAILACHRFALLTVPRAYRRYCLASNHPHSRKSDVRNDPITLDLVRYASLQDGTVDHSTVWHHRP